MGTTRDALTAANTRYRHELSYLEPRLTRDTASLARGFPAVCSFVFRNLSDQVLQDDVLARLLTFHNVLITSHQAFLTHEALANIAETTLASVLAFERGEHLANEVRAADVLR